MLRICAYFEYRGLLGSYTNEMGYFLMNRLSVRCFITLGTILLVGSLNGATFRPSLRCEKSVVRFGRRRERGQCFGDREWNEKGGN